LTTLPISLETAFVIRIDVPVFDPHHRSVTDFPANVTARPVPVARRLTKK